MPEEPDLTPEDEQIFDDLIKERVAEKKKRDLANSMITTLQTAIKDEIPRLLEDRSNWDSLIVNRRKPATYRVFTKLANGMRVCLHRFEPCHLHESFLHPHPWPGAFVLLQGKYRMMMGRSPDLVRGPTHTSEFILTPGGIYTIVDPQVFHAVTPLTTTYTIMVNGEPWDEATAHKNVVTTKGKDLDKMPERDLVEHLANFKIMVDSYLRNAQ